MVFEDSLVSTHDYLRMDTYSYSHCKSISTDSLAGFSPHQHYDWFWRLFLGRGCRSSWLTPPLSPGGPLFPPLCDICCQSKLSPRLLKLAGGEGRGWGVLNYISLLSDIHLPLFHCVVHLRASHSHFSQTIVNLGSLIYCLISATTSTYCEVTGYYFPYTTHVQ